MTAPASVSPTRRVIRTAVQVVLAVLIAIPAAVAVLPLSAAAATTSIGIAGALTVLISAAWNAYDRSQSSTPDPPA